MSPFLQLFLLGCVLTIILKGVKGKKITLGKVIGWGFLFAILFPIIVPLLALLGVVITGTVIIGIAVVMVVVALFVVLLF